MSTHLYQLLRERAEQYPDVVAIGGQQGLIWKTLTSRELLTLVDRLAEELRDLGVGEGDRIVYWMPNHWRTPIYFFATWKLGAVAVPFDREMNPEAGARILERVEPRLVVAGYGERPRWAAATEITEWWEPGTRRQAPPTPAPWTEPAEPLAVIVFTSGTTGTPKGVMLTHANLHFQAETVYERIPLDPACRIASILPLSHAFELGTLVYAIKAGAATHYAPSRRGPDMLRVLQEQQITHMIVVPQVLTMMGYALLERLEARLPGRVYRALNTAADRLPLPARRVLFWPVHRQLGGHLQLMIAGGAALPDDIHRLWERMGVRVVAGFGATECSPAIALAAPDGSTPIGSVGKAMAGVEVRMGERGELLVRGPNVMAGYWRDPERTAEVIHDGWYATGDLGTIEPDGNIRIVGRAKDLIVLPSGMNVWPQDVEDTMRSHPAVKDAAVLAVPTGHGGATLHAYLIPHSPADRATPAAQIVSVCNARLAQHQRVATASWWEGQGDEADFPRTAMLKVRRHLLPLPAAAHTATVEAVISVDDPVGQAIGGIIHTQAVQPHQTLVELGLDSLGLVELAIALEEKTGKAIDEDALRSEMTVDEVRALLAAAPLLAATPQRGGQARRGMALAPPVWAYTWGRVFRPLFFPFDRLLRYAGRPITVLGTEHLQVLPDQVILAGTHRSFADMPLVRYALSQTGNDRIVRRLISAIVITPNFHGVWAWLGVLVLGLHPLDQQRGREASLRALARTTQASKSSILIFPQGVHASVEAELAHDPSVRFRTGVAHLVEALGLPVVPFGLAGSEHVIPRTAEGFQGLAIAGIPVSVRRGPLAIAFGEPLRREIGETAQAFTGRLEGVCWQLARQAERATAGDFPQALSIPETAGERDAAPTAPSASSSLPDGSPSDRDRPVPA